MAFLYGDSTESGLELNYVELVRAVLEFGVEVLAAEHRTRALEQRLEERKRAAEGELGELRQLLEGVGRALDGAPGATGGAAQRCAAQLRALAQDTARNAATLVKAELAERLAAIGQEIGRERRVPARALEALLTRHALPGARPTLELRLDGSEPQRYAATSRARADLGLEWSLALGIPEGSLFAQPLRLERLAPHLEVRMPESGGWMRKGVRMRATRLGGQYVAELVEGPSHTTLKLRGAPGEDEQGFNLQISGGDSPIRLVRVAKGGEHSPPFEPIDEDAPRLTEVVGELRRELAALTERRTTLREARLDGKPIEEHDAPSILVQRLVAAIAPVIQEISRRSLSQSEFVLKRVLADGRREEIFVAKADLEARLDVLPPALRATFRPLGLGEVSPAAGGPVLASGRARTSDAAVGVIAGTVDLDDPDQTTLEAVRPAGLGRAEARRSAPPPVRDEAAGSDEGRPDGIRTIEAELPEPPAAGPETAIGRPELAVGRAEPRPSEPPPSALPRASERTRRPTSIPPGPGADADRPRSIVPLPATEPVAPSSDDDVTAVAVLPPRPPSTSTGDSVDVALNELDRDG